MNYRVSKLGAIPSDAAEDEIRYLVGVRTGIHELISEPARCLQAMKPPGVSAPQPLRSFCDLFTEELAEARRSPEFVRRALLEQTLLSKRAISILMVKLSMADSVEATSAYSAALSRLQSELRRNLRCLAELPFEPDYVEPEVRGCSKEDILQKLVPQHEQSCESETDTDGEKNGVHTELASNTTRQDTGTEAQEPASGRSRQAQSGFTSWHHRYGPPEAQGRDCAAQAVAQGQRPENATGKASGGKKRPSRKIDLNEADRSGTEIPPEPGRRHEEIAAVV